jgi:hypothetical protein
MSDVVTLFNDGEWECVSLKQTTTVTRMVKRLS